LLIGEYQHSLDSKSRLSFPSKLRESLGERFFITKGLDGCLAVYSEAEWQALEDRFRGLTNKEGRALQRYFFSGAAELEPDKQGRILIPANLREFAGLERDVMIIGASVRAEIWDRQKWLENQTLTDDDVVGMMENISF
jgi:MraZ protein